MDWPESGNLRRESRAGRGVWYEEFRDQVVGVKKVRRAPAAEAAASMTASEAAAEAGSSEAAEADGSGAEARSGVVPAPPKPALKLTEAEIHKRVSRVMLSLFYVCVLFSFIL